MNRKRQFGVLPLAPAEVAEQLRRLAPAGTFPVVVPVTLGAEIPDPRQRVVRFPEQLRISEDVGVSQLGFADAQFVDVRRRDRRRQSVERSRSGERIDVVRCFAF